MRTAKTMTAKRAGAIRALLAHRLRVDRPEQKRDRDELRETHEFWISDFERGLTPAGFDQLVNEGRLRIVG